MSLIGNYGLDKLPVGDAVARLYDSELTPYSPVYEAVGLSALFRSILNFNGIQYATMAEPVTLSGNFEIEIIGTSTSPGENSALIGGDDFGVYISTGDTVRVLAPRKDLGLSARYMSESNITPVPNKLNRYTFKRESLTSFSYGTQDALYTGEFGDIDSDINVTWIGGLTVTGSTNPSFKPNGLSILSVRIWTGGTKDTGSLAYEYLLSDSESNYQEDLINPDNILYNLPSPIESTEENLIIDLPLGFTTVIGNTYVLDYSIGGLQSRVDIKLGTTGQLITNTDVTGINSATISFVAESEENILRFRPYQGGNIIAKAVIRDPNGVTLQDTLPDDWEDITRAINNDFWEGTNVLELTGEFASSPSVQIGEIIHIARIEGSVGNVGLAGSTGYILEDLQYKVKMEYRRYTGPVEEIDGFRLSSYGPFTLGGFPDPDIGSTDWYSHEAIYTATASQSLNVLSASVNRGADVRRFKLNRYLGYAENVL